MAPTPVCTGTYSECIEGSTPVAVGSATVNCAPGDWVGPWTLVLEREDSGQYVIDQVQVVQTPGFGTTFHDTAAPMAEVTLRVCVQDKFGTRCGAPFMTYGSVMCGCEATTCGAGGLCNTQISDGCGDTLECGACTNGQTCNSLNFCCPEGQMYAGDGRCVCAPPAPCSWNWDLCMCQYGQ
jgi:hypothetical protein